MVTCVSVKNVSFGRAQLLAILMTNILTSYAYMYTHLLYTG